ncbi:MAG: cytochrome b/b6 domain-containing protein, partial [Paracoccus sp. (in: a-proteobacteria)]|nr:cytochrome b/b6 domain-containing protein [Paracoccus sp. (in: a-proteobacteria)]
ERVGGVVHWALYAVLILTPLSGSVAWFGGQEGAAEAHETLTSVLLALAALHVAGALYHQFVVKDGLMSRMSPH